MIFQVTEEMIKAGERAIDAYYDGTKDAPFEGSIEACYRAMRTLEPTSSSSESAMWEAREIWDKWGIVRWSPDQLLEQIARALDRRCTAQRERDAKIADDLYLYQWREGEFIYQGRVAAAIRSVS